jgi:hypothetical protein
VSRFSLALSLFDFVLFIIVVHGDINWYQSLGFAIAGVGTSFVKFNIMKFNGTDNFGLWQRHAKDLLVQQGMVKALYGTKPDDMSNIDWKELEVKAVATIWLCLGDDVMYHGMDKESLAAVWLKLEIRYMSKSLMNTIYLKQRLYSLKMVDASDLGQQINVFNQVINNLKRVNLKFKDEDKALMLLNSLTAFAMYENLVTTMTWGKEPLELENITRASWLFIRGRKLVMTILN